MLRAVALYHDNGPRPNEQNLVDYLNDFVELECQHWKDEKWDEVASKIKQALMSAHEIFGEHVFREWYENGERRQPINRGLFDSQVGVLSRLGVEKQQLVQCKKEVLEQYVNLAGLSFENKPEALQKIAEDFSKAMTSATGKGWASNKRVEAMQYIFNQALKEIDDA